MENLKIKTCNVSAIRLTSLHPRFEEIILTKKFSDYLKLIGFIKIILCDRVIDINKHIKDLFMKFHGIDLSKYEENFVNNAIQKRISEIHSGSVEMYSNLLEQSNNERIKFIDLLNIHYSKFFRNTLTFAVSERIILPSGIFI